MGGELWVDSEPGRGSAFFFTLCLAPGDPARTVAPPAVAPNLGEAGEPLRLLVAEDDPVNAMVAAVFLRGLGHRPVMAASGRDALEALGRDDFDAVLMDVQMPDMDGLDATRAIREGAGGERNRDIPIMAMTAHVLPEYRENCLAAGMDDYMAKPLEFDKLTRFLNGLAARGQSQAAPVPAPALPDKTPASAGDRVARAKRRRVLVVDDDPLQRLFMEESLKGLGYEAILAESGEQALRLLPGGFDLLLSDMGLPGMDGLELVATLRATKDHADLPVIMVSAGSDREARIKALEAGADEFLAKPVDWTELRPRMDSLLRTGDALVKARFSQARLKDQVRHGRAAQRRTVAHLAEMRQLSADANRETILCLASAAEFKDEQTARHLQRMSEYCRLLARKLKLPPEEAELIRQASPMHDVGKIGIPDSILFKPGRLTGEEMEVMRKHPLHGARILESATSPIIQQARVIALTHHERFDGQGYPYCLAGEAIPLAGRICAVADVFDALISRRPYKEAFPADKAFAILAEGSGSQFDPTILQAFLDSREEVLAIMRRLAE